jgi:LacI family transcriptional regulator
MMEATDPSGWQGDGMLVNDTEAPRLAKFIRAQVKKQPTVLFGANHSGIAGPCVEEDNIECGRLAAKHFLNRGYRNFAWISISRGKVERDRRAGFIEALVANGQQCTELKRDVARGTEEDTWNNRRQWLEAELKKLPKPLAVFALDDLLAVEVVEVCLDNSIRVPEDVAVIGAGNIEIACDCSPVSISSIDLNFGEMAYRAAELLDSLMAGRIMPKKPIIIPVGGVVLRGSSDAIAVTHEGMVKAVQMIQKNFQSNIGVGEIAQAAGISRRALHYLFAKELRRTPARHLLQVRLDHAKRMLRETDEKIGTIAHDCGFTTDRNLHRCFVRETELPPQQWREANRRGR